jgi:hypothetical protein
VLAANGLGAQDTVQVRLVKDAEEVLARVTDVVYEVLEEA